MEADCMVPTSKKAISIAHKLCTSVPVTNWLKLKAGGLIKFYSEKEIIIKL
jgi:hypothetical protein